MSLKLYMDEHVPMAITDGLRARGVDVLTAQEDGMRHRPDPDMLDRAVALGRVMFSQDEHFPKEAVARQRRGDHFAGVIYVHQLRLTVGQCVQDLELLAKVYDPGEFVDRVLYLPLK